MRIKMSLLIGLVCFLPVCSGLLYAQSGIISVSSIAALRELISNAKPGELDGKDWETCMTMNGKWGFRYNDDKWKSPETLIRNLCDIASKGGNYLLSVGPDALGQIPQPSIERLKAVGCWMKANGEAIYATKASPIGMLPRGRCTKKEQDGKTILYLSVFDWPKDGKLSVNGLDMKAESAKLLAGNKPLKTSYRDGVLEISVPEKAPDTIASVIKVTVDGKLNIQPGIK